MNPFIYAILVILLGGIASLLIKKAPFVDAEYKPAALWIVLVVVIVLVIYALWPFVAGLQLPSPRRG